MKVTSNGSDKEIFGFNGGACNCALFLGTLRNWIAPEVYNERVG